MTPDEPEIEKILQNSVDALYELRDHFFETHSVDEARFKNEIIEKELVKTLEILESYFELCNGPKKSIYLYEKGRAYNILAQYSPEAETCLSKAVKLNPTKVEAWNELGETYWKRGNFENAKNCFQGALNHIENKVSHRNLSIVYRQCTSEDKLRNIENGLTEAHKAVALDVSDGISWSILGNAYLAHFFSVSRNPKTLKLAMAAYNQAGKDVIAASTSELHYNQGIALKYEEDFSSALECFDKAMSLDPSWEAPKSQKKNLLRSLNDIISLISCKGKLKTKRFSSLVASNQSNLLLSSWSKYQKLSFSELVPGKNCKKFVTGKVICSILSEDSVPFTFCIVDSNSSILVVNLYDLASGKGVIIGDSLGILEPNLKIINTTYESQNFSFNLLRVESPRYLMMNGKEVSGDFQAGVELSTFTKDN